MKKEENAHMFSFGFKNRNELFTVDYYQNEDVSKKLCLRYLNDIGSYHPLTVTFTLTCTSMAELFYEYKIPISRVLCLSKRDSLVYE